MSAPKTAAIARALRDLGKALDSLGSPAMVIGGIAAIGRGVHRTTLDVDALLWGPDVKLSEVVVHMTKCGFEPRIEDAVPFAAANHVLLLHHVATKTPIDLAFAWLPFEADAIARATVESVGGVKVRIATAEDLIVLKSVAGRPKDWSDIEELLAAHGASLDLDRVRAVVSHFSELIDEPARASMLDDLITEAGLEIRSRPRRGAARAPKRKTSRKPRAKR